MVRSLLRFLWLPVNDSNGLRIRFLVMSSTPVHARYYKYSKVVCNVLKRAWVFCPRWRSIVQPLV